MLPTTGSAFVAKHRLLHGRKSAVTAEPEASRTGNGMYEKRFGFHRKPFQSILTDQDYFESESYQEIKPTILHAVRSDLGVAILTGPAGIGKTVTLEHFRRMLESDSQVIVLRGGTVRSAGDLLYLLHRRLINSTPDVVSEPQDAHRNTVQRWEVVDRLQRVSDFWGPVVLLLDDAHLAGADVFSELRCLLEEEAGGRRLVRLLIAGPLVLEEVLAEQSMSDFSQRIRTHVFLQPLRSTESVQYLNQQVQNCGGNPSAIFEREAIERIVAAADGVPRCLNLLADESLMVCENDDLDRVTVGVVNKALTRLQHLPYSWNVSLFGSDSEDDDDEMSEAIEIGASAIAGSSRHEFVASNGVIEIGGSSPAANSSASFAQTTSLPENVVEIGAPPPQTRSLLESQPVVNQVVEFGTVEVLAESVEDETETLPSFGFNEPFDLEPIDSCEATIEEFFSEDDIATDFHSAESDQTAATDFADSGLEQEASRLDRKFDAVSFSQGTLEFDEVSVAGDDHGSKFNVGEELSSAIEAVVSDVTGDPDGNLEHHLVLAGDIDEERLHATTTKTGDSSEDESGCFRLDVEQTSGAAGSGTLSCFMPRQPPGDWHTASVSEPSSSSVSTEAAVGRFMKVNTTNRTAVFDRYTWCELGRPVTSDPAKRSAVYNGFQPDVEWPPCIAGVAPATSYPISEMDEDYAELLTDLGILPEAKRSSKSVHRTDNDDVWSQSLPSYDRKSRGGAASSNEDFVDPDKSIEHIQSLLEDEQHVSDAWLAASVENDEADAAENVEDAVGNCSGLNEQENVADIQDILPLPISEDASDAIDTATLDVVEEVINSVSPAKRQLFTLPIDIDEVNVYQPTEAKLGKSPLSDLRDSFQHSISASAAVHTERHTSDGRSGDAAFSSSTHSATGPNPHSQLVLSEQESEEELQHRKYSPQLLRQARARVVAVPVALSQLKRAAGAESVSAPVEASQRTFEQRSAHLSVAAEDSDSDNGQLETEKPGSGFGNLFTRLRNMRSR